MLLKVGCSFKTSAEGGGGSRWDGLGVVFNTQERTSGRSGTAFGAVCGLREGEEPSAFRRAESNAAQSPNGTEV